MTQQILVLNDVPPGSTGQAVRVTYLERMQSGLEAVKKIRYVNPGAFLRLERGDFTEILKIELVGELKDGTE